MNAYHSRVIRKHPLSWLQLRPRLDSLNKWLDSRVDILQCKLVLKMSPITPDFSAFSEINRLLFLQVKFMLSNIFNKFLSAPLPIFATWIYTVFHLWMVGGCVTVI